MGYVGNMFQHTHGYRHQVPLAGARRTAGRSCRSTSTATTFAYLEEIGLLEGSSRESIGRALALLLRERRALMIQAARSLLEPRHLPQSWSRTALPA